MVNAVKTLGDVDFEHVLGPKGNPVEDGFDGIPTRTSGAKAIGMRRELRFPFGFEGLADDRLQCPVGLGWDPSWAFFATATLRYPRASQWRCLTIETEGMGEVPSLHRGEGLHPINARGLFPTIILGHAPHREQPCIP